MIEQALVAIEGAAPAVALRQSTWGYPLVNAGHILGVALLVGSIVPLDLRLLGAWRTYPLIPFLHVLRLTAAVGLGLAIICGLLLFATAAADYVRSPWFQFKMGFVFLGVLNALFLLRVTESESIRNVPLCSAMPITLQVGALISLVIWPVALVLGRLVGYF